jgi:hypothetical protein
MESKAPNTVGVVARSHNNIFAMKHIVTNGAGLDIN